MIHYMNLNPQPFAMIASGKKTIELRLNDEKRRRIAVGDEICFINTDESCSELQTKVLALHRCDSFKELYNILPLLKCGYTAADISTAKPEDMDLYYSPEQQRKYGVLGIELVLLR